MPGIGDVFVTLRLEGSAFERGVAAAQAQAATLNASMQRTAASTAPVASQLNEAGRAASGAGEKFELSTRVIARFSAIATQQLVPALDGSRQAIEGAVAGISHLAGGYGTLAVAGAGIAVVLAGVVYNAINGSGFAAEKAAKDFGDLGATLRRFEVDANAASIAQNNLRRNLENRPQIPSAAQGLSNLGLTPGVSIEFEGRTLRTPEAIRQALEGLRARQALGDFSEAGGLKGLADRNAEAARKSFDALSIAVQSYQRVAQAAGTSDPLGKLFVSEIQIADDLIKKLKELRDVEGFLPELVNKLIGDVESGLTAKIAAATQQAGVGAAGSLGLSPSSLIFGNRDIEKFQGDVSALTAEIGRLAQAGTPARDLFNEIADAQGKADASIAALKTKYADTPAIFNRLVDVERQLGSGGLQRSLDANVRNLQGIGQGIATIETPGLRLKEVTGQLATAFGDAGENSNFLAGVLQDDLPSAASAAAQSVVIVTGNVNDLARAVANARFELGLLIGQQANIAVAAPGNF